MKLIKHRCCIKMRKQLKIFENWEQFVMIFSSGLNWIVICTILCWHPLAGRQHYTKSMHKFHKCNININNNQLYEIHNYCTGLRDMNIVEIDSWSKMGCFIIINRIVAPKMYFLSFTHHHVGPWLFYSQKTKEDILKNVSTVFTYTIKVFEV